MTTLMLVGSIDRNDEAQPKALAIRFFLEKEGCGHVLRLAKKQVKKRYTHLKQSDVSWDVYEVQTTNYGWPKWRGPAFYYEEPNG